MFGDVLLCLLLACLMLKCHVEYVGLDLFPFELEIIWHAMVACVREVVPTERRLVFRGGPIDNSCFELVHPLKAGYLHRHQ